MKKLGVILVIIICIGAIVWGRMYYHRKVQLATAEAKTSNSLSTPGTKSAQTNKSNSQNKSVKISDLTANLPKDLQKMIETARQQNKKLVIDMIGGNEISGLDSLFQKDLNKAYGQNLFEVKETILQNKTSLDVYHEGIKKVIGSTTPDIIIYTPLIMNDDRLVRTQDTTAVISLIEQDIQSTYPKAYYMIQPPNKTSDQPAINDRIDSIKDYMKKQQGVPYLNYLKKWPNGTQMADVVKSDGHTPNAAGLKIWSDYLGNYFTGK